MIRILPSIAAALAACTSPPQETAMNSPGQNQATTSESSARAGTEGGAPGRAANLAGRGAGDQERAALGPVPQSVSAAENPLPAPPADLPPEAQGRRTLSTAFVMVGPDGLLTVKLRDGRELVLRNVVMRRKDYCGVQMRDAQAGTRYCGGYAEVSAARPGGAPAPAEPDLAAPNPMESRGAPPKRE